MTTGDQESLTSQVVTSVMSVCETENQESDAMGESLEGSLFSHIQ